MNNINCLISLLNEEGLAGAILTDGYNIHYLSGYRGHCGCMLIIKDKRYILTDSRYTEQVTIEAKDFDCVDIAMEGYSKTIARLISESGMTDEITIGFENEDISYKQYKAFYDTLSKEFDNKISLKALDGKVSALRMVKTEDEIEKLAKAEAIGDMAFDYILGEIRPGMTEMDVAIALEFFMRKNGAEGLSFDTIAASGENSSLPHATPGNRTLKYGDFLTMDFGCKYEGYCSDMTRTIFIGDNITDKQQQIYDIVLEAQMAALEAMKPGVKGSEVDKVARDIIASYGYGKYFGHGLGHSVGLFIHEEPRCSVKCDTVLKEGMLMTCEPGIYLPGEFGVRIEDMVVLTMDGIRNLTTSTKELIKIH